MKPSKLMFNRTVRTRLPTVRDPVSTLAVKEAWEKDQQERLKRKEVTDKMKTAQERMVKVGDKVLVAQRKTTTEPPFDPTPYTITEVKGTQADQEEEAATARGHRDFTKEEWQVAMGPWRLKTTSPGPKERKRRQQEAIRRDKEQYRLTSRKGQEEPGELSE